MEENKDKALNTTVIKLGVVSFFADIASEMLYPLTPIFLTSVLGASMSYLGLIEGVAEAIASLLKTYSGSWSDLTLKRKPFILLGYFLGAISKPFIGLSQSWFHVLGARALDRAGKGLRSAPRDALIADSVNSAYRGAAFGWHRGMDTLGAAIGPMLAIGFLALNPESIRELYYWALIPGLISVLVVLSINEPVHKSINKKWENPLKAWGNSSKEFKKYIFAWGIFSLVNSSDVFLLMKAKSTGLTTITVILLFCVYNLVYAFSSPYLGKLSDQLGRRKILISGLLVFSLVYFGFGIADKSWHYWMLFMIYGLYMGATEGVGKALAIDLSLPTLKATGIGILGTVTGVCTIVASVLAGLIWDHLGSSWTFNFSAVGALLSIFILLKFPLKKL